ncbi:hypothetical protein [Acidobacterium sp. S8]|uniref:hypothetical protein n=1 Tax=Acidobacterium sp. S8 TaxID=1641854 RepID=UPI00131E738D|nr:hypothetical protein [Acidobacterium sp. S8]
MPHTTEQRLTVDQTDEIIRTASPWDGAIEDCEEDRNEVRYFFETGRTGRVCRQTGTVTIS